MRIPVYIHDRIYIPRSPEFSELLEELRMKFNYSNPERIKRKAMGFWTGNIPSRIETWDHISHSNFGDCLSIPRGGMQKVRNVFEEYDCIPQFVDKRLLLSSVTHLKNNVTLRPDQLILAKAMIQKQNCLIRSPTASGKTEVALKVIEYILNDAGPVLIVVWETELFEQWIERICQRFDIPSSEVGTLGGGRKKKIKPITVGMQQTIKNKIHNYATRFGGVICDEVQRFAATTFQKIEFFPAKYRIGISADETRNDKKEFLIYDIFGEIAEEIDRQTLIERGALHDVILRLIPTDFDYALDIDDEELTWFHLEPKQKDFNDLLDVLCYDNERNDLIWKFMYPVLISKQTILVISHRVEHVRYWNRRIQNAGFKSGLMLGGNENKKEFKRTKEGLLNGSVQVGVGTIRKIGQALDVPPWNRGFIITPTSQNEQQFEQIIGRLRRTSSNKTEAVCYIIWDRMLYPFQKMSLAKRYPNVFVWDNEGFLPVS